MDENRELKTVSGKEPGFLGRSSSSMAAGLIFLSPIIITLAIVFWILGLMSGVPATGFLEITSYYYVNQAIKLIVISVLGGIAVAGIGKFASTGYGTRLEDGVDRTIGKTPILGTVYSATKTTADTVLGSSDFGHPVKVDLGGMKITGFETGNGCKRGQNLVFIPTSPNITSGFLVEIDEQWVTRTDETKTEAITRVLSAGFGAGFEQKQVTGKGRHIDP